MEENNTPSNLEVKGDPSVTLTIRLIMQGKVSLFMAFLISSSSLFFFLFCSFVYFFCRFLVFSYDEYGRLTISIIVDFIPKSLCFSQWLLLLFFITMRLKAISLSRKLFSHVLPVFSPKSFRTAWNLIPWKTNRFFFISENI